MVRRLWDLGASGVGSKVWVLTIGVLEAIPEQDSIADAREARFLGEYVLNRAFDLNERSDHIHLGIQTRNTVKPVRVHIFKTFKFCRHGRYMLFTKTNKAESNKKGSTGSTVERCSGNIL